MSAAAKTMPQIPTYDAVAARRAWVLARQRFAQARKAEIEYGVQLRKVARVIGDIVQGFAPEGGSLEQFFNLREALVRYGELLRPWARNVATRMLADVSRRDEQAWAEHGKTMGRALQKEILGAPTGAVLRKSLEEQVTLITSLPIAAAERVHKLALQNIVSGQRADVIAEEIMRSGQVSKSRAMTIARTETTRVATELTKARAQYVGSEMFIWRTALDSDVRPTHKVLEGKAFRWDDPPVTELSGERALPGGVFNCRCYPEPIIPDQI